MIDPYVFRPMAYGLLMWGVAVYAFRRGDREEIVAAVAIMIASYLSALLRSSDHPYQHFEVGMAMTDLGLFVVLQTMALRSAKFWPIWLAAIQGVTLLGHFSPLMPGMMPAMARNAVALWAWPQWLILWFGIDRSRRGRGDRAYPKGAGINA